jgi:hypothetical protein
LQLGDIVAELSMQKGAAVLTFGAQHAPVRQKAGTAWSDDVSRVHGLIIISGVRGVILSDIEEATTRWADAMRNEE